MFTICTWWFGPTAPFVSGGTTRTGPTPTPSKFVAVAAIRGAGGSTGPPCPAHPGRPRMRQLPLVLPVGAGTTGRGRQFTEGWGRVVAVVRTDRRHAQGSVDGWSWGRPSERVSRSVTRRGELDERNGEMRRHHDCNHHRKSARTQSGHLALVASAGPESGAQCRPPESSSGALHNRTRPADLVSPGRLTRTPGPRERDLPGGRSDAGQRAAKGPITPSVRRSPRPISGPAAMPSTTPPMTAA